MCLIEMNFNNIAGFKNLTLIYKNEVNRQH